jgi:hypothetical protein
MNNKNKTMITKPKDKNKLFNNNKDRTKNQFKT